MDEQEQEHILGIYGSISMITGKMLSAARTGDWDRLVALEHDCRALIETLKRSDAGARAGRHFAQRKIAFIHKILADDAEIRKLTEPVDDQNGGLPGQRESGTPVAEGVWN